MASFVKPILKPLLLSREEVLLHYNMATKKRTHKLFKFSLSKTMTAGAITKKLFKKSSKSSKKSKISVGIKSIL